VSFFENTEDTSKNCAIITSFTYVAESSVSWLVIKVGQLHCTIIKESVQVKMLFYHYFCFKFCKSQPDSMYHCLI